MTVEKIQLTGVALDDHNDIGIRFEKGFLIKQNCHFLKNEDGILAGSEGVELIIEKSEFGYDSFDDGQSHGASMAAIKRLQVTGSYVYHHNKGYLLKSRAATNMHHVQPADR